MIKIKVDTKGVARIIGEIQDQFKKMGKLAMEKTTEKVKQIAKESIRDVYELDESVFNIPAYYEENIETDDDSATISIMGEEIPLEEGFYLDGPEHTDAGDPVYYRIRRGITEIFPKFGFIGHGTAYKRRHKGKPIDSGQSNPFVKYGTPSIPDMIGNQSTKFLISLGEEFEKHLNESIG